MAAETKLYTNSRSGNMVFYEGKPVIEGIDKITLILHPALRDFIRPKGMGDKLQVKRHKVFQQEIPEMVRQPLLPVYSG
jgi:hypothetical protein